MIESARIWGAHAPRVRARRLAERISSATVDRSIEGDFGEAPKPAREARALPRLSGFTLIELLVVMVIIIVLAGLILATAGYVQNKGKRSRAEAEIAAISAGLENYKADNGIYPRDATTDALDVNTTTLGNYDASNLKLYEYLSGDTDHDRSPEAKSYFAFKPNQLAPTDQTRTVTAIRDPFGNSYGYSTMKASDSAKPGYNPTFDLWSIADGTAGPDPSKWIKNW